MKLGLKFGMTCPECGGEFPNDKPLALWQTQWKPKGWTTCGTCSSPKPEVKDSALDKSASECED